MDTVRLTRACEEALPHVLSLTEHLVNMDSGSEDIPALRAKAEELEKLFSTIGGRVELRPADPPRQETRNVIAVFHGTGKAKILLLTHYDTVFPSGEAKARPFRIDGDKARGPGVADMQASIAMVLAGIPIFRTLCEESFHTLTVFCRNGSGGRFRRVRHGRHCRHV